MISTLRPAGLLGAIALAAACATDPAPRHGAEPPSVITTATPGAAPAPGATPSGGPAPAPASPSTATFDEHVRPILRERCAPCHEPGGKMYDRLPFDDPAVVAAHREGVLKRITDDAEGRTIRDWLSDSRR